MNEHTQSNPYAEAAGHDVFESNPYLGAQASAATPDLDAAAPVLRTSEAQRLNRKALVFLAGIVALILLMAFWVFSTASARGDEKVARPRQEKVTIPDLPMAPDTAAARPAAAPIGVQPYTAEPTVSELPPLPPVPAASPAYAAAYATASPPRMPTLLERRMGMAGEAAAAGPQETYPPGMGVPGPAPASNSNGAAKADATSAQYIQHPDALLVRGTYLRCVLETHIVTDIAGFTSCIVTEPVYSINGRNLLLPKGSKILGRYDSEPNGPRVAVVWDRILTPTGIDVNMASPGVDGLGGAGHPGHFNAHWPSRIASALMISLVSDAFKYAGAKNGPRTVTVTNGLITDAPFESNTARTVQRLADQALDQGMRRPPTVTINQGTMVNVYVAKDVDFSGVLGRR